MNGAFGLVFGRRGDVGLLRLVFDTVALRSEGGALGKAAWCRGRQGGRGVTGATWDQLIFGAGWISFLRQRGGGAG